MRIWHTNVMMMTGLALWLFGNTVALAQEDSEAVQLIGVIAESSEDQDQKGVVVLKDLKTERTHTVKAGDTLSWLEYATVVSIKRNRVELKNAKNKSFFVAYTGTNRDEEEKLAAAENERLMEEYQPWLHPQEQDFEQALSPEELAALRRAYAPDFNEQDRELWRGRRVMIDQETLDAAEIAIERHRWLEEQQVREWLE